MKRYIVIPLAVLLALSVALNAYLAHRVKKGCDVVTETRIDTIFRDVPKVRDSVVLRYITQRLPLIKTDTITKVRTDTIVTTDSADVIIPITQKSYQDEYYQAWVSGYLPNLDSIKVYRHTDVVRVRDTRRWSVGIGVGGGITPKGVQPYIGVSVQYSLLRF